MSTEDTSEGWRSWWRRLDGGICAVFYLRDSHFVRAPGDVIVAPFDNDSITALVLDGVGDIVELVAHVLDIHLLAGSMWSMHAYHQHVGTWMER